MRFLLVSFQVLFPAVGSLAQITCEGLSVKLMLVVLRSTSFGIKILVKMLLMAAQVVFP
jgi:hypothetical protein